MHTNNLAEPCPALKQLYNEIRSWPHFTARKSMLTNICPEEYNNEHNGIDGPSKSSIIPIVPISITKMALRCSVQGTTELFKRFKGVVKSDGDRCGRKSTICDWAKMPLEIPVMPALETKINETTKIETSYRTYLTVVIGMRCSGPSVHNMPYTGNADL